MLGHDNKHVLNGELEDTPISDELKPSDISFGVLIIPSSPIREQIEAASTAISKVYDNEKRIDNNPFPAHISLHLAGIAANEIPELKSRLDIAIPAYLNTKVSAKRLYTNSRGFLAVGCSVSKPHASLIRIVREQFEVIQTRNRTMRPHILEKWNRLSRNQQKAVLHFGTYKDMAEDQHLSIAHVSRDDVDDALEIARQHVSVPQDFSISSIVLADIGHLNEQWNVLAEWKALAN